MESRRLLPSASIAQSMVENGFNFTNPSGTSFWKAHNMGGVKTSKLSDFPITNCHVWQR